MTLVITIYRLHTDSGLRRKNIPLIRWIQKQTSHIHPLLKTEIESGEALVEVSKEAIVQLQNKFKKLDNGFKALLSRQTASVDVAVTIATTAIQVGAIGAVMGILTSDISSTLLTQANGVNPQAMASIKHTQVQMKMPCFHHWASTALHFPCILMDYFP